MTFFFFLLEFFAFFALGVDSVEIKGLGEAALFWENGALVQKF